METELTDREIKVLRKGLVEMSKKIMPSVQMELEHIGEGQFCELLGFINKLDEKLEKLKKWKIKKIK